MKAVSASAAATREAVPPGWTQLPFLLVLFGDVGAVLGDVGVWHSSGQVAADAAVKVAATIVSGLLTAWFTHNWAGLLAVAMQTTSTERMFAADQVDAERRAGLEHAAHAARETAIPHIAGRPPGAL